MLPPIHQVLHRFRQSYPQTQSERKLDHALNYSAQLVEIERPPKLDLVPNLVVDSVLPVQSVPLTDDLEGQALELLHHGDDYFMQGQLQEAIAHYRRAIQLAPQLVDAYQSLAEALSQQGNLEEAAVYYQKALDLIPLPAGEAIALTPPAEAFDRVAESVAELDLEELDRSDQPDESSESQDWSIEQLPWYERAAFYLQQGKVLCDQQQWQEAIAICEQAVKLLAPHSAMAYRLLGRAMQAEKQLESAETAYRVSLTLEPVLSETYARLGSVCAEQDRLTEAVKYYQQAIELDDAFAGAYLKLGEVWQRLGDREQAADCLYRAYQLEPSWVTPKTQLSLGTMLLQQGKLEQADWCYRQAIALAPDGAEGYFYLGILLEKQGHATEAIQYHQQAVERDPQNARLQAGLGRALMKLEQWQGAIACYQRITELTSDYGQIQEALVQMERCQRSLVAESYGKMAEGLVQRQQWQEAAKLYRQAVERNPKNVRFQMGLGKVLTVLDQWEDAMECYQKALRMDTQNRDARMALANVLLHLGRFEEAARYYRSLVHPLEPHELGAEAIAEATPVMSEDDFPYTIF